MVQNGRHDSVYQTFHDFEPPGCICDCDYVHTCVASNHILLFMNWCRSDLALEITWATDIHTVLRTEHTERNNRLWIWMPDPVLWNTDQSENGLMPKQSRVSLLGHIEYVCESVGAYLDTLLIVSIWMDER